MRCATHKLRVRVLDACTAASRASFSRVGASGVYKRLSLDVSSMRDVYDVLVVGSGYGGSITACRMARTGKVRRTRTCHTHAHLTGCRACACWSVGKSFCPASILTRFKQCCPRSA